MKKFMKGLLATTMVFAMMTSLVGCGGSEPAEEAGDAAETLVMATNAAFPPYEYYEGKTVVGIDAEVGQAIADKLGMGFKIEDMEFDAIIPAVTSGKASFGMAGMTVTEERAQSVDFSTPYYEATQVMIVKEDSDIANLHGWQQGSFSGMTWDNFSMAVVIVMAAFVLTFLLSKPIGAYQLGEAYAQSMGVNIRFFRVALILLSSVLSACVTAFAGPISFVGIAVPHLMKRLLKTAKPIVVIPAVFLGGAVFCMFCDLIARTAFAPTELNISTVTSIFGAPVVIGMMLRRSKGEL